MDRNSRLVWLGTGLAVAVVWVVGLTLGERGPATRDSAPPQVESALEPAQPSPSTPATIAAQPQAPAPGAHPKSPGQVLPGVFLTETRDPAWAKDAEATIQAAFADAHVPEGSLLSVECRRRICKAEIWLDPREHVSFGKANATLREHFGTDVGFHRVRGGVRGEPEQVAIFFPRKGYKLTDFEGAAP